MHAHFRPPIKRNNAVVQQAKVQKWRRFSDNVHVQGHTFHYIEQQVEHHMMSSIRQLTACIKVLSLSHRRFVVLSGERDLFKLQHIKVQKCISICGTSLRPAMGMRFRDCVTLPSLLCCYGWTTRSQSDCKNISYVLLDYCQSKQFTVLPKLDKCF